MDEHLAWTKAIHENAINSVVDPDPDPSVIKQK
jgi:hypothetical protein